jgi:hypothetical protein
MMIKHIFFSSTRESVIIRVMKHYHTIYICIHFLSILLLSSLFVFLLSFFSSFVVYRFYIYTSLFLSFRSNCCALHIFKIVQQWLVIPPQNNTFRMLEPTNITYARAIWLAVVLIHVLSFLYCSMTAKISSLNIVYHGRKTDRKMQ